MKRHAHGAAAVIGLSLLMGGVRFPQTVHAQTVGPVVFQAAGPTVASIQSMVDAFRAALGGANNGNAAGPLIDGRREINWDGGGRRRHRSCRRRSMGSSSTRGGRFTTPGTASCRRRWTGSPRPSTTATYASDLSSVQSGQALQPHGANVTNARFFVPGGGELPATTNGFGAIFSDVDQLDDDDDNSASTSRDKAGRRPPRCRSTASGGTCCSAPTFQRRRATRACHSSAWCSTAHASPPSGSRRGTSLPDRTTAPGVMS